MPISGNFTRLLFLRVVTPFVNSSLVIQPMVVAFRYDYCVSFTFPRINREVQDPCIELD